MNKSLRIGLIASGLIISLGTYFGLKQFKASKKDTIIESVASIDVTSHTNKMQGSGLIIELNDKNYILTSNNICILNNDEYNQFVIKTKSYKIETTQNSNEIFTDEQANLCLIPMKDYFKGKFVKIDTTDEQATKESEVLYLTYNHSDNLNKLTIIKGKELTPQRTIASISNKKLYDFVPLNGDGGSPVFNYEYKFVGLVSSRFESRTSQYGGIIPHELVKDFLRRVETFTSK